MDWLINIVSNLLGVPARRLAVALSAASPRTSYRAVGFPLQSLTQNAGQHSSALTLLFCFAAVAVPLHGSAQTDIIFRREVFEDFSKTHLGEIIALEKELGSIDQTPDHLVTIGEGLYPNKTGFVLATPKMYLREKLGYFDISIGYYYAAADSSIKARLYEWNKLPEGDDLNSRMEYFMESEKPEKKANLYAQAQEQFDSLHLALNRKLGPQTETEVGRDRSNSRDSFKWIKPEGMSAYLMVFKNDGYREIRLVLYED